MALFGANETKKMFFFKLNIMGKYLLSECFIKMHIFA